MVECIKETVPDTESTSHRPEDSTETEWVFLNNIPENHSRGRKEYNSEYADIASKLVAAGFTEQDIGYALGISLATVHSWKGKYPQFKEACEDGRRASKKRLIASAFKLAMGYKFIEKNIKHTNDADGNLLKSETSEFHRELPGSPHMLLFLLMNMDRQLKDHDWENVNKVDVTDSRSVAITIDGKSAKEQIAKLAGELGAGSGSM